MRETTYEMVEKIVGAQRLENWTDRFGYDNNVTTVEVILSVTELILFLLSIIIVAVLSATKCIPVGGILLVAVVLIAINTWLETLK